MSKLFLMMGVPGSGKTTWCKEHLKNTDKYISRDEIRFNLIKNKKEYFSREKEVFKIFIEEINKNLELGFDVYADATHLDPASREKVLVQLKIIPEEINVIYKKVGLETALKRNRNREGLAFVPEKVIINMFNKLLEPQEYENIDNTYIIED